MFDDEDEFDEFDEPEITPPNEDGSAWVSQISLVGAICEHLGKMHGDKLGLVPRQTKAIIEATNLIVAAFAKPVVMASPGMGLAKWLASDDTGLSSKYMAEVLCNSHVTAENHHPIDPSDFGRCLRMLDAVPHLRRNLYLLTDVKHGPVWNKLAQHWPELETLYNEELPTGQAPKLYERMKELIQEATEP